MDLGVIMTCEGASVSLAVENLSAKAGRYQGLIFAWGRSPGGGHGNSLHYSCLDNPMDRGVCRLQPIGSHRSRTPLKQLGTHA